MFSKIIVEGVDGSGKTTYINKIISENPGMNYEVIHCTRHTDNNIDFFMEVLTSKKNIILDRSYLGQFVYNDYPTRKENEWLTLGDLEVLEDTILEMINRGDLLAVYVEADPEVCLYNCKKDSEDSYYTLEYIRDLQNRYRYFIERISKVPFQTFHNDYVPDGINGQEDSGKVDYGAIDYSALPKVVAVDFDGTLVPDNFPHIGKLNEKLVYELYHGKYKDYKKVLFTHRSGEYLIAACEFCAQHGLYFDAVNDDVPEIKAILHRNPIDHRKVWFNVIIDDKAEPISVYES